MNNKVNQLKRLGDVDIKLNFIDIIEKNASNMIDNNNQELLNLKRI